MLPWLFRHAGDIITRCRIDHTGKTPYEKLKGKKSGVRMLPFGETVHFQPVFHSRDRIGDKLRLNFIYGVYVGIDGRSSAHICLTEEGAMYTRSIRRLPEGDRYNGELLGKVRGCLLYTSPSPRDQRGSRMPSSA